MSPSHSVDQTHAGHQHGDATTHDEHHVETDETSLERKHLLCVVPLCVTAIGSVALFFAADLIYHALLPIVSQ
ncbi:MAG: hypothetical protein R3C05_26110 [Pirellulaceae bacterium]